jgi:hypothetical protein
MLPTSTVETDEYARRMSFRGLGDLRLRPLGEKLANAFPPFNVFKPKRKTDGKKSQQRMYRGRYRLDGDRKLTDVPLGTFDKQVAAERLKNRAGEAAGAGGANPVRFVEKVAWAARSNGKRRRFVRGLRSDLGRI